MDDFSLRDTSLRKSKLYPTAVFLCLLNMEDMIEIRFETGEGGGREKKDQTFEAKKLEMERDFLK